MILDRFDAKCHGEKTYERMLAGLALLKTLPSDAPVGRVEIDGDRLFCLVQEYTTKPAAEKKWESHRRYADIQAILVGREALYYSPLPALEVTVPYQPEKDVILYSGPDVQPIILEPGNYAVLWPHDGHKPGCILEKPEVVRKAVIKLLIEA